MATAEQASRSVTGTLAMPDGVELFTRAWPVENARAAIAVSHGYGEHSGRYEHIAARLNAEGYSVYAYDHRAHGRSPGTMGYLPSFDRLVEDFGVFTDHVASELGHPAEFIFGHSMGGLVAALHVERRQPKLKGLVISSGALKVAEDVAPLMQKISGVISAVLPKLPVHQVDPKGLSHDSGVVSAYETDPLVYHGKMHARTGHGLMTHIKEVIARADRITQPVLILHGTEDQIATCEGSKDLHAAVASKDKTLKLYEGAYHEVFNDDQKEQFMQDVVDWLNARV